MDELDPDDEVLLALPADSPIGFVAAAIALAQQAVLAYGLTLDEMELSPVRRLLTSIAEIAREMSDIQGDPPPGLAGHAWRFQMSLIASESGGDLAQPGRPLT
jgi:hypothetical protein